MTKQVNWMKAKPEDVEKKIIELAKEGLTAEKIGLKLRDEEGIPKARLLGVRIRKVLEKENLWISPEKKYNDSKIEALEGHIKQNKHDYSAKRSLVKSLAKRNTLNKFD